LLAEVDLTYRKAREIAVGMKLASKNVEDLKQTITPDSHGVGTVQRDINVLEGLWSTFTFLPHA